MKETAKTKTTNGSILKPWASSLKIFNIEEEEPPAPAALEEFGWFCCCCLSLFSWVAFLLARVFAPPGTAVDDYKDLLNCHKA